MIRIDLQSRVPIYEQLKSQIVRLSALGIWDENQKLPSVRSLAREIGVNPNTVQKAYRLLEEEGLIQSRSGAKSCVVLEAGTTRRVREQLLEQDARALITAMRQMGLTKSEAVTLIETYWE